jgi:hypothetical protein
VKPLPACPFLSRSMLARVCVISDRRDAALMLAIMELGPRVGETAWAHRRVRAALSSPGGIWIGGLWVNLA